MPGPATVFSFRNKIHRQLPRKFWFMRFLGRVYALFIPFTAQSEIEPRIRSIERLGKNSVTHEHTGSVQHPGEKKA